MTRYFYNDQTGKIITKSSGSIHILSDDAYIDKAQDVDFTQYTVDLQTLELVHTPVAVKRLEELK